jgi:hypothetical protein
MGMSGCNPGLEKEVYYKVSETGPCISFGVVDDDGKREMRLTLAELTQRGMHMHGQKPKNPRPATISQVPFPFL